MEFSFIFLLAFCDFEDASICNYQQDPTDNFDWTRKAGRTTSSGTGPTNDHTYGTSAGDYIYVVNCVVQWHVLLLPKNRYY